MARQEGTTKDQVVHPGIDLQEATATIADTLEREPQLTGVLEMFRKLKMQGLLIDRRS